MSPIDDELLPPLDPLCPHCNEPHDIGEIYDGGSERCASCGALLQAASNDDGFWLFVERGPAKKPLTGRQRTRRLWAKRGRA
jgi:hypothetical protein